MKNGAERRLFPFNMVSVECSLSASSEIFPGVGREEYYCIISGFND